MCIAMLPLKLSARPSPCVHEYVEVHAIIWIDQDRPIVAAAPDFISQSIVFKWPPVRRLKYICSLASQSLGKALYFRIYRKSVRREPHKTVEYTGDSNARCKDQQSENHRVHGFHVVFEEIIQM